MLQSVTSAPKPDLIEAGASQRLPALDTVRGLAIIFVVIGHYLPGRLLDGLWAAPARPFGIGGVVLFFFLSGFLIERQLSRADGLARYGIRRACKIMPAYLVCLGVILLLDRLSPASPQWSPRTVLANSTLMQDVFGAPLMCGVFWTLLIEVKFYALAPLLMRGGKWALYLMPLILLSMNLAIFALRGETSNLATFLTFCFIGMQFGLWHRGEMPVAILGAGIILAAVSCHLLGKYYNWGVVTLILIDAMLMMVALRRPFELPALSFIGIISYSWYLYHAALGYPMVDWLSAALRTFPFGGEALSVAITVPVTLLAAWFSFVVVEEKGVSFGKRVERFLKRSQTSAATAPRIERG